MNSTISDQSISQRLDRLLHVFFWMLSLALLFPSLAQAETIAPSIKQHVTVQDHLVTLSDLIDNVGHKGNKAVFRSPDPGTTGKISINRIIASARKHGLTISMVPIFRIVTIKRASRIIEIQELEKLIRSRLEEKIPDRNSNLGSGGDLMVTLRENLKNFHIAPDIRSALNLKRFDWSAQTGKFSARFLVGDHELPTVHGTANRMVEVIVAKTAIPKGTIISPSDLQQKFVKPSTRLKQPGSTLEQLVGLSAKRRLPAGRPIYVSNLEAPRLIKKNQLVTILLEAPGLVLRTEGKALADASLNQTLRVLNTQTKRIIHATAKASGLVSVKLSRPTGSGS